MFITQAYAQSTGQTVLSNDMLMQMLPFILIFVVFYFLLLRPQQMRLKEQKAMIDAVKRGDEIVTGGGIIGKIVKVIDDKEVMVEIADGIQVRILRSTIATVVDKSEIEDVPSSPKPKKQAKVSGK